MIWTKVVLGLRVSAPGGWGERTHRLQVLQADGELPQRQQQIQLCAQKRDVAHLQESEHQHRECTTGAGAASCSETLAEASAGRYEMVSGAWKQSTELARRPLSPLTSNQSPRHLREAKGRPV